MIDLINNVVNPFITNGYAGREYFCDREKETSDLVGCLTNGNNVALISPRRLGKTDLIRHCFAQNEVADHYYTFIIDIYSTRSVTDLTVRMGRAILDTLKPKGRKHWERFLSVVQSVWAGVSYDAAGSPTWGFSLGEVSDPVTTLDEIFHFLQHADHRCLVAIDEFQQILKYADVNIEALLRTYVQQCSNCNFVFSGSQRHLMGSIFTSPARPFYQSVTVMNLKPIACGKYVDFCQHLFVERGKKIETEAVERVYELFDGGTYYMQRVMNALYAQTPIGGTCMANQVSPIIDEIVNFSSPTYEDLIYQLPEKQCKVLRAISLEGKAGQIGSARFVKKYGLSSPSSVNSAVKGLLDRELVTQTQGVYTVYDRFLDLWLKRENTR